MRGRGPEGEAFTCDDSPLKGVQERGGGGAVELGRDSSVGNWSVERGKWFCKGKVVLCSFLLWDEVLDGVRTDGRREGRVERFHIHLHRRSRVERVVVG